MPILPEIFERQLSLETRKDPQQDTERDPFALWERMADDLDEIAANTRAGFRRAQTISALPDSVATKRGSVSKAVSGSSSQTSRQPTKKVTERDKAKPAARLATGSTRGKERPGEEKDGRRKAAPSRKEDSKQTRPEQQGQTDPARKERTGGVGARQERKPVQATQTARQGGNQGVAKAIEQAANAASADRKMAAGTQTPARTKSAEAIQAIKAQKAEDKRQKGFFDRLKDAFQDASEKRYKGENEAVDMAGLAVGGPFYVAAKELKQVGESLVGEDSFLGRARESFKKSGEEKKSPGAGRQEAKDRVRDYKLRDAQGRFIKRADRATVTRDKQKIEIADESLELAYDEAREENKRHKELVKAVKSLKPGLLDRLLGRGGRGGRAGRAGKDGKDARNLPDAPDKKNKTKKGGTTPDLPDGKDKVRKDSKADIPDLPDKPDKRATVEARDSKPRRRRGILGKLGLGAGLAVGAGVAAGQIPVSGFFGTEDLYPAFIDAVAFCQKFTDDSGSRVPQPRIGLGTVFPIAENDDIDRKSGIVFHPRPYVVDLPLLFIADERTELIKVDVDGCRYILRSDHDTFFCRSLQLLVFGSLLLENRQPFFQAVHLCIQRSYLCR